MKKKVVIIENNIIATNTIRKKLTVELIQLGYDVTVLTTGTNEELAVARTRGINIIDVKASNQHPLEVINYMRNLRQALRTIRPDVCLTFTIRPAIWGNIVTRTLKIPTITNITGIGPLFESDHLSYRAARRLYKFVLKPTAKIFFQNNNDMQLFLKNGFVDANRAARIPGSGVDFHYYAPIAVQQSHGFKFLFISRLIKDKGILEYVEAARILKREMPGTQFCIVGPLWTQNLKANIVTQAELDRWISEGNITYLGVAEDVRPLIASADCIVLPSYREGMSNVLLEAASMEKPCVTCDTTGCNDIVEDGVNGYLCEVRNAVDLSDKMRKMYALSHEERQMMGKEGRKKIIRHFNKQIVIDAYLDAIEGVTV
jgi:glycosyltransferase involved in cell wall biosynthesis